MQVYRKVFMSNLWWFLRKLGQKKAVKKAVKKEVK